MGKVIGNRFWQTKKPHSAIMRVRAKTLPLALLVAAAAAAHAFSPSISFPVGSHGASLTQSCMLKMNDCQHRRPFPVN